MILPDHFIAEYLQTRQIMIEPPVQPNDIRPAGIRVHLSSRLLVPEAGQVVDPAQTEHVSFRELTIFDTPYVLKHGEFALASTIERVLVDRSLACQIEGRSTLARLGLLVHCSSSMFDNIHDEARAATLELANVGTLDIVLRSGMPIAMLVFSQLAGPVKQQSQTQYQGQVSTTPPNLSFKR